MMKNNLLKESFSKTKEKVSQVTVKEIIDKLENLANSAKNLASESVNTSINKAKKIVKDTSKKVSSIEVTPEDILIQAVKVPGVKVQRSEFLYKELIKYYPEEQVLKAIKNNPASAGILRSKITEIADQVIDYETNKVSAISFAAGLPGGAAIAATIPADVAQYFGFMLQ